MHPQNYNLAKHHLFDGTANRFRAFSRRTSLASSRSTTRILYGYHVEVETYESNLEDLWRRFDIAYDPSIGYVPRFTRSLVSSDHKKAKVYVNEHWVTSARQCSSGGFVPTEWYEFFLSFRNFASDYPKFNDETVFDASRLRNAYVGHFRTTMFANEAAR